MAGRPAKSETISWLSTKEASARLSITLRSLYRFIDEGDLVAYRFGRVIRIKETDLDRFIEASRIVPGSLEHLYPEVKGNGRAPAPAGTVGALVGNGAVGNGAVTNDVIGNGAG
jgi:excisionase family DNA binding protein